jgi:serine/threonine protein kinase
VRSLSFLRASSFPPVMLGVLLLFCSCAVHLVCLFLFTFGGKVLPSLLTLFPWPQAQQPQGGQLQPGLPQFPGVTLISQVADSGQAIVYRGQFKGKDVAVKVFKKADGSDFKAEVRALLKTAGHPNIMEVLDYFERPKPCIVMAFISGGTLWEYLRAARLSAVTAKGGCSYKVTAEIGTRQTLYSCDTCAPGNLRAVICAACATKCHAGHALKPSEAKVGYCDCGPGGFSAPCQCLQQPPPLEVLDNKRVIDLALGVGNGLMHLHSHGMVHR